MYKNEYAKSFRDLAVYEKAVAVERSVFELTKAFPKSELYSLTDQIRRSSRSVGAQVAEAWAKRRYEAHFISKLTDADAEQQETQHWLEAAERAHLVTREEIAPLLVELHSIGRMLNGMVLKADLFCQTDDRLLKEDHSVYFVAPPRSGHRSQITGHRK